MPRGSLDRKAQRRLDEGAQASARYVDLQLDVLDETTGELLHRFGGLWDRKRRTYAGDAPKSRVVKIFGQQRAAFRDYDAWLGGLISGDRSGGGSVGELLMMGGQRSGKTANLIVMAIALAVSVPGSIAWVVVPSEGFLSEPVAYLEAIMPRSWYQSLGAPHWTYTFPNGSTIVIRSGNTPGGLKQGKATGVFVNEAQQIKPQSYDVLIGRVMDDGGIVVGAANPPDVGDKGIWITDYVLGCQRGTRRNARYHHFHPKDNPHIEQSKIEDARARMDKRTFAIQIGGELRGLPDQVLYTWDPLVNERPVPDLGDVTRQFTKHFERGRAYDYVVGVDVQTYPWIVLVMMKMFQNPLAPSDYTRALTWVVGEVFCDKGDEITAAEMLTAKIGDPKRALLVLDASCFFQQMERKDINQRPDFEGRFSSDLFKSKGYKCVRPDIKYNRNPHVIDRCRAGAARICTEADESLVFADPALAPRTCETIRKWRYKKSGMPDRTGHEAHAGDALTYPIWRYFPRRRKTGKVDDIKIVTSSFG